MAAAADRFPTRLFVHLSLAVGIVGGFGPACVAFAALALGLPAGAHWTAIAQAHGHAQLFGFAGLMVLGLGLVFLPRLRGTALRGAGWLPLVLALYGGGVVVRSSAQALAPFLQAIGLGRFGLAAGGVIALASVAELVGALLGVGLLASSLGAGPPLAQRPGPRPLTTLLVFPWLGLLAALALNAWSTFEMLVPFTRGTTVPLVGQAPWVLPPGLDALAVRLALLGWLVPMSVAFAARSVPPFLWTRPAPGRWLAWGLSALVAGLALDVAGTLFGPFAELSMALEGAALLWLTGIVCALGTNVGPPGKRNDAEAQLDDLTRVPLTESFVWLAVAGALLLLQASLSWLALPPPPEDALRHTLGTGFALLLVVGTSLRLVPGYAAGRRRHRLRPAAVAIWAAQAAALLRVAPPLAVWVIGTAGIDSSPPSVVPLLLALSGLAGVVSLIALWTALWPALGAQGDTYDSTR